MYQFGGYRPQIGGVSGPSPGSPAGSPPRGAGQNFWVSRADRRGYRQWHRVRIFIWVEDGVISGPPAKLCSLAKRARILVARRRSAHPRDARRREGVRAGPRATRVLRGRMTAAGSQGRAGGARLHGDPVTIANAVPALRCAHNAPIARSQCMPIPILSS